MSVPANTLQSVARYLDAGLGYLENQNCFMDPRVANFKFKNFQNEVGQLGSTVNYEKPYRFRAYDTLTITNQATEMRVGTLTVNQAKNVAVAFTAEQFVFTVEEYMDKIGMGAIQELGAVIEADLASIIPANTYRFYGDGSTAINSFGQLASALAYFRDYGAANNNFVGIIDPITQASIVNSGLSQFALARNNELANSWDIGRFSNCDWFISNHLPIHTAGYAGQNSTTLTFSSINAAGNQITFTGAGTQTDFFLENDLLYFETDVRYLSFVGHSTTQNQVQVRITASANSSGGTVVANIEPALVFSSTDPEANLSRALAVTDTAKVIDSHRCGLLMSGKPFFVAMPTLPSTTPFPSAQKMDPDTGVSLRMYYGEQYGMNNRGLAHDVIWGRALESEYCMRICFPL